ncbi:hypothetical protein IFM89_005832 [Coptis chinensis]|uniref:Uncharacterized protein n=1 Tax=Coptis chinensis TaxID=261450 RepID=A0A835LA71_9MAGN|nr:hypothetical protein IFM89_005832 [Coptis chinensis]
MAPKFSFILFLLAFALVVESSIVGDAHFAVAALNGGGRGTGGLQTCNGLVGECIDQEEETMIDSGHVRRSLWYKSRYISYGVLQKNRIPCGHHGRSYYDCRKATKINPYRRGCSRITHCRRNLS